MYTVEITFKSGAQVTLKGFKKYTVKSNLGGITGIEWEVSDRGDVPLFTDLEEVACIVEDEEIWQEYQEGMVDLADTCNCQWWVTHGALPCVCTVPSVIPNEPDDKSIIQLEAVYTPIHLEALWLGNLP